MNTDLLREVADRIELEDRFDLSYWYGRRRVDGSTYYGWDDETDLSSPTVTSEELLHRCDTVGCVGGWTAAVLGLDTTAIVQVQDALGLTDAQAHRLFYGNAGSVWATLAEDFGWETNDEGSILEWKSINAIQAAKVLRMIADGEVTL